MTTLEPGASEVFTQGLGASPASTAFLASSAAPTMTDGLEVLVHEVMAAITTEPWSTEVCRAVLQRHLGRVGRPAGAGGRRPARRAGRRRRSPGPAANGSEAGKVSATSSSSRSSCT